MSTKPILSILIPTYNRADYLRKCLKSVLQFSSEKIEILVSNNASSDHTNDVANSFNDPRFRYFEQPVNVGFIRNFQFLCLQAQGTYLFFLTDDDYLLPEGTDLVIRFIEKYEPYAFKCGVLVHQIKTQSAYLYSAFPKTFVAAPDDFKSQALIFWNSHIASCTCFRKDVVDFELFERNIQNLYPTMLLVGMAQKKLGYLHEPIAVHIWENEVFWDDNTSPDDSSKLLAHRGDLLNILENRVPLGFLVECEKLINRFSLNYFPITRFLTTEQKKERQIVFKIHAVNTRYSKLSNRIFLPVDRFIRTSVASFLARLIVMLK
jgi:glycosyltransferase involved in cell wall biosynthesis